eukprot:TRINITY_DN9129_c0_g1_i1.p1 TRINITY_DN9129_c0_g1~~TRINITY_DN9129_c0_g1_i1.p1  ORF type:complete len:172 (+),score=84.91 TRINITY_DN9129_c0_g1_i1:50-565(+)
MKVYKDLFTEDEMSSDTFPVKEVLGVAYEFETKQITRSLVGEINIGANASAEEGGEDEGADDSGTVSVNNLVDAHRLQATVYDKKSYMGHIKAYMKRVSEHLKANNPDRVEAFQKGAQELAKQIIGKFDDYEFYTGENMDPEAMVALKFYKEDGIIPYFLMWKDGLKEEKY